MKPIERLQAVFQFEQPDRVPLYDKLRNAGAIAHYAGEPFVYERGNEIGIRACRNILDATANAIYPQAERVDRLPDGFTWKREHWTSWIIERPFHDLDTLAAWVRQEIERLDGFDPRADGYIEQAMAQMEAKQAALGDCLNLIGLAGVGLNGAYHYAGLEMFCYLLADQPELVSRWSLSGRVAVSKIVNLDSLQQQSAPHPQQHLWLSVDRPLKPYDILRKELS